MAQELGVSDLTVLPEEPRIKDVVLAERLGFDQERSIRKLIERNKEELEGYGALAIHRGAPISGKGRRMEVDEYLLNEGQAVLVCMFSRTPQAAAVRREVIKVFLNWRHGQVAVPAADPLWRGMDGRIGITNRVMDLQARSGSEDYVRAAAYLPRQARSFRQPKFFSDLAVRKMVIDLHRQVTIQEAIDQIKAHFGWSPTRSAICRFWQRLDGARGAKFPAAA